VLSQLQLSRALGVSRTPLREALRMLQEEGLVDAEPNQRARVKGFDSSDLESVYSTRILLESFGVAVTIPTLGAEDIDKAEKALSRMRTATRNEDFAEWRRAHREFHLVLVRGAGEQLVQLIGTCASTSSVTLVRGGAATPRPNTVTCCRRSRRARRVVVTALPRSAATWHARRSG
jgi:DNA-binding GntR family transcriptional regulator